MDNKNENLSENTLSSNQSSDETDNKRDLQAEKADEKEVTDENSMVLQSKGEKDSEEDSSERGNEETPLTGEAADNSGFEEDVSGKEEKKLREEKPDKNVLVADLRVETPRNSEDIPEPRIEESQEGGEGTPNSKIKNQEDKPLSDISGEDVGSDEESVFSKNYGLGIEVGLVIETEKKGIFPPAYEPEIENKLHPAEKTKIETVPKK
ncbi:TPA: hypothetical protein HA351_09780 [Methanosarcinaceae archaeon]|nr:hypothetical protein [Methanosarcinaceae archaeon]